MKEKKTKFFSNAIHIKINKERYFLTVLLYLWPGHRIFDLCQFKQLVQPQPTFCVLKPQKEVWLAHLETNSLQAQTVWQLKGETSAKPGSVVQKEACEMNHRHQWHAVSAETDRWKIVDGGAVYNGIHRYTEYHTVLPYWHQLDLTSLHTNAISER